MSSNHEPSRQSRRHGRPARPRGGETPVTSQLLIYQSEDGRTKLDVRLQDHERNHQRAHQAHLRGRGAHLRGNCSAIPNSSEGERSRGRSRGGVLRPRHGPGPGLPRAQPCGRALSAAGADKLKEYTVRGSTRPLGAHLAPSTSATSWLTTTPPSMTPSCGRSPRARLQCCARNAGSSWPDKAQAVEQTDKAFDQVRYARNSAPGSLVSFCPRGTPGARLSGATRRDTVWTPLVVAQRHPLGRRMSP
jgi:hypothetical protein